MISIDLTVRRQGLAADNPEAALGEEVDNAAVRLPPLVQLPGRPLTLADVSRLAVDDESHRYELVDGNLLVRPLDDADHAAIITRLLVWLVTNGYGGGKVLDTPGLRISGQSTGRSPDILVLRTPAGSGVEWIDPADAVLVVEVVSSGSETLDRLTKPGEYAHAGITHFWRVERDGPATVHLYRLGVDERGAPAYIGHRAALLDDLLAATPPHL